MNRDDFITAVQRQGERSLIKQDITTAINAIGPVIVTELLAGGNVSLPGLGKFVAKRSKKQKMLFLAFDFAPEVEARVRQQNCEVMK